MSFYDNTIKDNYQAFNNQRLLFNLLLLQNLQKSSQKNNINNINNNFNVHYNYCPSKMDLWYFTILFHNNNHRGHG